MQLHLRLDIGNIVLKRVPCAENINYYIQLHLKFEIRRGGNRFGYIPFSNVSLYFRLYHLRLMLYGTVVNLPLTVNMLHFNAGFWICRKTRRTIRLKLRSRKNGTKTYTYVKLNMASFILIDFLHSSIAIFKHYTSNTSSNACTIYLFYYFIILIICDRLILRC